MTRHTWRPGGAIDPGATYYPMDGARQRDPLEPDDVIAALDAHMEHTGIVDAMAQEIENLRAELDGRAPVAPADHWSPWLEWRGGPCPLPADAEIDCKFLDGGRSAYASPAGQREWSHSIGSVSIIRFRYRAPDKLGWLDFDPAVWTPPAELWADDCPVRLEWAADIGHDVRTGADRLEDWRGVHHVRLVAREKGR